MSTPMARKGKQRLSEVGHRKEESYPVTVDVGAGIGLRDGAEGDGGEGGIVLPLNMVGDGLYEA